MSKQVCDLCHGYGTHDPWCPEAPDAEPLFFCHECGEEMYDGDVIYLVDDKPFCRYCRSAAIAKWADEHAEGKFTGAHCAFCHDTIDEDDEGYIHKGKMYHKDCFFEEAENLFEEIERRI